MLPRGFFMNGDEDSGNPAYRVYRADEEVAMVSFAFQQDEHGYFYELVHLFVEKRFRGLGIASALIEKIRREAAPYPVHGNAVSFPPDQVAKERLFAMYRSWGAEVDTEGHFKFPPLERKGV